MWRASTTYIALFTVIEMEILKVDGLRKHYRKKGRAGRGVSVVRALDGVTMSVDRGEIYAVVGETGSGKSTLGRIVVGLLEPTEGSVKIDGSDIFASGNSVLRNMRRTVQIIFQDPYSSLNPRFNVKQIVEEPLKLNRIPFTMDDVLDSLRTVGLIPAEDFLPRYPHEMSGGQRQRVAIARSIVMKPEFIVADEPVSMLDASMRASFLDMIAALRKERGISMMLISHDISTAYYASDRTGVLYLGKIVEEGRTDRIVEKPLHPYTKALIQAIPSLGKVVEKKVDIKGTMRSATGQLRGCQFRDRCIFAMQKCEEEEPELHEAEKGHFVACHLY